jgi:hypothetical protein
LVHFLDHLVESFLEGGEKGFTIFGKHIDIEPMFFGWKCLIIFPEALPYAFEDIDALESIYLLSIIVCFELDKEIFQLLDDLPIDVIKEIHDLIMILLNPRTHMRNNQLKLREVLSDVDGLIRTLDRCEKRIPVLTKLFYYF